MTQTARDSDPSAERCASGEDSARDVVQVLAGGPDSTEPSLAQRLGVRLGPTSTFATTEHFNLQTARSITVAEANGRASIYLAALSSNLIALAFIGQMSRLGAAFYAFALILLPVLVFVGVVTFLRLVQSSLEDIAFAHRIALLRDLYLRLSPELEPYVLAVRGEPRRDGGARAADADGMAANAHRRRDGRGGQQCGRRRSRRRCAGGRRRALARPPAGDWSARRSRCADSAPSPPSSRA